MECTKKFLIGMLKPNEPRGFGKIGIRPKDGLTMIGWLIATHE